MINLIEYSPAYNLTLEYNILSSLVFVYNPLLKFILVGTPPFLRTVCSSRNVSRKTILSSICLKLSFILYYVVGLICPNAIAFNEESPVKLSWTTNSKSSPGFN